MNSTVKTVLFWLLIGVSALLLWEVVKGARDGQKDKEMNFSEFMTDVDQGRVHDITVDGMQVKGKLTDNTGFHTTVPSNYPDMIKKLQEKGVVMSFRDVNSGSLPLQLLGTWAPL
ncbi:MAG: ATP-dependent metallopeptidase FtsH/Yme1/Tma family protein, partial [Candidatus Sulfotelmatobacter sp.]